MSTPPRRFSSPAPPASSAPASSNPATRAACPSSASITGTRSRAGPSTPASISGRSLDIEELARLAQGAARAACGHRPHGRDLGHDRARRGPPEAAQRGLLEESSGTRRGASACPTSTPRAPPCTGTGRSASTTSTRSCRSLRPLNPYGESKRRFDLWALEEAAAGRTPPAWAGFRFFNVYGFGERHKGRMASVVLHGYDQVKAKGEIRLFESHRADIAHGHQTRDFVDVSRRRRRDRGSR